MRKPSPPSAHRPKVAVVDSGIVTSHERIGRVHHVQLEDSPPAGTDRNGHGTACAGIILAKAPRALLYSLPIFDESLTAPGDSLLAAIRWTIEQRMDVVNLSLGTTDVTFRDALAAVCRQARETDVILVAAEDNEGRESYPAAFPDVIGVTGGRVRERDGYYYRPGEPVECVARGEAQRVCWTDPRYLIVSGTSFAAPHITGLVARIRQEHPGAPLERVREILQAGALEGEPPSRGRRRPRPPASIPAGAPPGFGWIRRAALYPFNKEMHTLVRGRDLLDFEIVGIADAAGKGLAGRDAGEALGLPAMGVRIQPRLSAALEGADTLILGYVDLLSRVGRKDVLFETVSAALEQGLHVFSFAPVPPALHHRARAMGLHVAVPGLSRTEIEQALNGDPAYPPVDVPVLGVFGTSAQQGKFTLQLALRRQLLRRGYRLGQVGTEHHSGLFAMDVVFPMGYASNVSLALQSYVPFLDYKMRQLCQQNRPELILIGSQSGTVPYDLQTHATHSLATTAFLLGTKPDACILVVNSIDVEAYIQDTIDGIRALTRAPTLALAMSDQEKHILAAYGRTLIKPRPMPPGEVAVKLRRLEDRFGLPAVAILSEEGQRRLVDGVIDHFAAERPTSQAA